MIQTPTRNFIPIQQLSPDHTLNKPMLLDKVGWGLHFLAAGTASSWAQTKEQCMAYSQSLLKRNAQC
jgi:hypothetical protein